MIRVWEKKPNTKLMRDGEFTGLRIDENGTLRRSGRKPNKAEKKAAKRARVKINALLTSKEQDITNIVKNAITGPDSQT